MATSNTFNVTSATTTLTCNFGATDRETIVCYLVSTGGVISSAEYTISGVSDSSANIVLTFDDFTAYVGDSIKVAKYTEIDTGTPADAMLVDLSTAANISPTTLRNEFRHLYDIVGQITGGSAVGTVDLGDLVTTLDNSNALADIVFASPTLDGDGNWDGTDTLSIGGDTTVEGILDTHETRLDTAESDIDTAQSDITTLETNVAALNTAAGFPNPFVVAGQDVTLTDAGTYFTTDNVEAALQQIALYQRRIATIAAASRLDHVQTLSTTADAFAIALYGQYGVICAPGGAGDAIWRSSNYGRTWTIDTGLDAIVENPLSLAFNSDGSVLVAVGGQVGGTHEIATSADYGNTWTGRENTASEMTSVCWSGSLFVAVGTSGLIYTSSDGTTWTARTADGTPANITLSGVCWSSELSLFVAVGTDSTGGAHIEIQTSPDGTTWTARTAAASSNTSLAEVAQIDFGSSTYLVAVGNSAEIQYSADGITWTAHPQSGVGGYNYGSIAQVPTGAILGVTTTLQYHLMTSITRVSSARYPEDNTAPAATAGRLAVGYSDEFGIVAAGTNGNIWASYIITEP